MTALLLAALLVGTPAPARNGVAEIQVAGTDAAGSDDAALTSAVVQALIDAGVAAVRANEAPCRASCVRVTVRRADAHRFVLLVDGHGRADGARSVVELAPSAPAFDQIHALAIEAEMLADRARARRPRPPPPAEIAPAPPAADGSAPPPVDEPPPEDPPPPAPPAPLEPLPTRPETAATIQSPPATPARAPERLALNVAATALVGMTGDLSMHGISLGTRLHLSPRVEARAAVAFLAPQRDRDQGEASFHRELLPLELSVAFAARGAPSLRLGTGVEAFVIDGDQDGREASSKLSIGALGRIEYRLAVRSFALLSALQVGFHPSGWSNIRRDDGPVYDLPVWTVGASLGLEFTVL